MDDITFWLIFSLVTIVLSFILKLSNKKKRVESTQTKNMTFGYPPLLGRITFFGIFFGPIALVIGYLEKPEQIDLTVIIFFIFFTGWLYLATLHFTRSKIILAESYIKQTSLFGSKIFQYDSISKMVIYYSTGETIAGITRLYSNGKKIKIEAFLMDYENLIWELRYNRCKNATIVEYD